VVVLSVLPALYHVLRERRQRKLERAIDRSESESDEPLDQASSRSAGS
jgi:hypothetical protein